MVPDHKIMKRKSSGLPSRTANRLHVFDTSVHPEGERQDRWQEHVARNLASFEFRYDPDTAFYGRLETLNLGSLRVNRGDCSAAHWLRLSRHLADGRDDYGLYIAGSGPFRLIQGNVDSTQGSGHFALIDNARPSEFHVRSHGADYDIVVPREALRNTQRVKNLSTPPILGIEAPSLRILRSYADSIFNSREDLADPVLAQKIGDHLLDLIILGLQPTRDAAELTKKRGLRAARLRAILSEIQKLFCDPGIGPGVIATRLNISERYLHALLEDQGLVFTRIVLELRLNKALNLLSDPRLDHLRIGQIAYECGFNDLSYFNRCFRSRFGDTPGGIRSSGAR